MQKFNLSDFIKGWFIGNFDPSIIKTNDVEVAVKIYKRGDHEAAHYHKIATEISVVISGIVSLNEMVYYPGDIIKVFTDEVVEFNAITDAKTVVVKFPGASNDKYSDPLKEK